MIAQHLRERMVDLFQLRPGWDGHDAQTISASTYCETYRILEAANERGLPTPGIFPKPDGGLALEWASPTVVLGVEVLNDEATYQILKVSDRDSFVTRDAPVAEATEKILEAVTEFTRAGLLV